MLRSCVIAPPAQAPSAPVAKQIARSAHPKPGTGSNPTPSLTAPTPSFSWTNPSSTHSANPLCSQTRCSYRAFRDNKVIINECHWLKKKKKKTLLICCCSHFCVRINWIIYFVEWPSCWLDFPFSLKFSHINVPSSAAFISDFAVICSLITVKKIK